MDDDDHWSEASKAVRAWVRAGCPPFREPLDKDKHREWTSAVMNDDEPLVRSMLRDGVNLYVKIHWQNEVSNGAGGWQERHYLEWPLDMAIEFGHGGVALAILEHAGSGRAAVGQHPEVLPTASHPSYLLIRAIWGTVKLLKANSFRGAFQRRNAMAEAVLLVLQSTMYDGGEGRVSGKLVDLRTCYFSRPSDLDALFELAESVEDEALAARLRLAAGRFDGSDCWWHHPPVVYPDTYSNSSGDDDDEAWVPPPRPHPRASTIRRFVARAVVRTLLRRYVKTRLIMWYWREAAERGRYAAPDAAGFEADMAAPLFTEGALGA